MILPNTPYGVTVYIIFGTLCLYHLSTLTSDIKHNCIFQVFQYKCYSATSQE